MYQYHDIHDSDFERLVIYICDEIFGAGVQGFSKGPDGGKDGTFDGTANLFPSIASPWKGKTIIQAKHTTGINKHFLESDFYSPTATTCILNEEIQKIIKLKNENLLDNYILFANRNLTGGAQTTIKNYIAEKTGLSSHNIAVLGIDDLDKWIARYQYIADMAKLTPLSISPIIRPETLADVITQFAKTFNSSMKDKKISPIERTTFEEKNALNNMTSEFAKTLKRNYMSYEPQIYDFLTDAQNEDVLELYQEAVEEFQLRYIIPSLNDEKFDCFDKIFNNLVELLISRNYILSTNKRLTRIMVFYMYWNCDIGISKSD